MTASISGNLLLITGWVQAVKNVRATGGLHKKKISEDDLIPHGRQEKMNGAGVYLPKARDIALSGKPGLSRHITSLPVHQPDCIQHRTARDQEYQRVYGIRHGEGEYPEYIKDHKERKRCGNKPAVDFFVLYRDEDCNDCHGKFKDDSEWL
jgi:hypothetical protein